VKKYTDSDYAVNKKAKGIVYRFADMTVDITLDDYLSENPGKCEFDFAKPINILSDRDYYELQKS